ncbi:MAG TPA: sugar transferase [Chthoniobacterales bacterium]|nr:sugar transferase [Chthoniobacterales bacterium]
MAACADHGVRPDLARPARFSNEWARFQSGIRSTNHTFWALAATNDWVRLDLDYIDRWSLALDFKILLRTIPAVIMGLGAK